MRPLPALQRSRAAIASVVGHGASFALLALIGTRGPAPPAEAPLILAELVTVLEPAARPTAADEADAPQPPAAVESATDEPSVTSASPPEPGTVAPEAPPPIEPVTPRERVVAPPPEPLPVERLAERFEPRAEPLSEPAAPPLEPAAPPLEPAAPPSELPAPPLEAAAAEAAVEPPPAAAPARALASHEERAVRRHLSSWTGRFDAEQTGATVEWRDAGQEYTAVLRRLPAGDSMGLEQLSVELTTERDGERLVTELRMNRVAFSNFAQFIDRWDPDVQIHDDLIDGRFHSNTEIRVSRERGVQPVFNGKVTVAAGDVRTDGVGYLNRRTMFPAGVETRVRRIALPPRAAAFDDGAVPADRVRRVAQDSLLTFRADGTFEQAPLGERAADDIAVGGGALGEAPFYFVAADDVALHVRGTVNGKVLVYSPERIVIVDDVRYAADPRSPAADDYLGLVAERTVEIDEPEVTGPGDLEVHASIYARTRFAVRDYRSRRSGTLAIYGSVTAGSLSATEPRFATRIEFDDRLTTMRAPGFPMSDRYELDSSSGEWRVVGAAN